MSATTPVKRRKRGRELPGTKLTESDVRAIRERHATTTDGERAIARDYGVSRQTVHLVLTRETWGWVE